MPDSVEHPEVQAPINYMPVREFVEEGYLQELNRRFLHPLGLALEVRVMRWSDAVRGAGSAISPSEPYGTEGVEMRLGGIWDYRDDPEGVRFADDTLDYEKFRRVERAWIAKSTLREATLGYMIQPEPASDDEKDAEKATPPADA